MPNGPLFKVNKDYQNPKNWELENIIINSCSTQSIPITFHINKKASEKFCTLLGFSNPDSDGSGAWTESNDVRIIAKLDLTKKEFESELNISVDFKPLIQNQQKELKLSWFINDELINAQTVNKNIEMTTELNVPIKNLIDKEHIELKILMSQLKSPKEMGINNDSRKLGLFISQIKIR